MIWTVLVSFTVAFLGPVMALGRAAKILGLEPVVAYAAMAGVLLLLVRLRVGAGRPKVVLGLAALLSAASWAVCLGKGWVTVRDAVKMVGILALLYMALAAILVPVGLVYARSLREAKDYVEETLGS
jgi:hypothetical protein